MTEVLVLDTSVVIKFLVAEDGQEATAERLVLRALSHGDSVMPAFAWTEVGSVLRKKVRQGLLSAAQSVELWRRFCELPIDFVDNAAIRMRAWEIAERYGLPTLYDAAFLACTELAIEGVSREFWTADRELLRTLGDKRPSYVHELGE